MAARRYELEAELVAGDQGALAELVEALQARGGRKSEVLLTPILREQLTKLNRVRWRGREQAFSPDAIEGAIAALRDLRG